MKKIFPSTILQSLMLLLFGVLVATSFLSPHLAKYYPKELDKPIVFIVAFSAILLLANYINHKKGNSQDYDLKPDYSGLGLMMLLVCSFEIAVVMPANFFISQEANLDPSLHRGG